MRKKRRKLKTFVEGETVRNAPPLFTARIDAVENLRASVRTEPPRQSLVPVGTPEKHRRDGIDTTALPTIRPVHSRPGELRGKVGNLAGLHDPRFPAAKTLRLGRLRDEVAITQ